jgi:LacI family transcriptional regulator
MSRRRHIGLVFDFGTGYCRGVLRGIKQYAEAKPEWILMPVVPEPGAIRALARLGPEGLIAYGFREAIVGAVSRFGKPWVNVSGVLPDRGVPRVGTDDVRVGELAARHLLDCGLRHLAFIGHDRHAGSSLRERGFREEVGRAGLESGVFREREGGRFDSRVDRWASNRGLSRWMLGLPRPAGVATYYDPTGVQLSEACRESGLHVPDDLAIVGVGDDDLICDLARPSLSSVALPTGQIGFEAAALLDRLLEGGQPPDGPILLPPVGVVARRSSDVLAIADPDVATAVRLIREHAHEPIRVDDVLLALPISRRALERKFRAVLDRGVSEEIRRVHLDLARNLLAGTDLAMPALAARAGFSNARHLSVAFRQETGLTPTAYRRQFRGRSGGH